MQTKKIPQPGSTERAAKAKKTRERNTEAKDAAATPVITSIKGTDANLQCRGFQFEIGKTYTHDGDVIACFSGFHACPIDQHPLSVFEFYSPAESRFFKVRQGGKTAAENTKLASATITIDIELSIGDLVKRAWDYVWYRATKSHDSHVTIYYGAASATGYQGAASATGNYGAASATGEQGAAMVCGYEGKVKGADGNALFAVERNTSYEIVSVACGIVGRDGVKADTWYQCRNGKMVEAA